jgi:hypothetical protein
MEQEANGNDKDGVDAGEPITHVILACDESGAKGYADGDEQSPGEVGVFAGIMVPEASSILSSQNSMRWRRASLRITANCTSPIFLRKPSKLSGRRCLS